MKSRGWYWWVALFVSCVTTGAVAVSIALRSQAEQQRKICVFIVSQDAAWSETTPTTETGRRVAEDFRQLRRELGCPAR